MLTPEIAEAINRQIENEMFGAYVYLSLSIYFDGLALDGFAAWMAKQSGEELDHAAKLIRFLRDHNARATFNQVRKPPQEFAGVIAALEEVLQIEQRNTKQIKQIYGLAGKNAVHSVEILMRWFIEQQGIEEKFARQALARAKLAGNDKAALLVLDQQFGEIGAAPAEAA